MICLGCRKDKAKAGFNLCRDCLILLFQIEWEKRQQTPIKRLDLSANTTDLVPTQHRGGKEGMGYERSSG
jgi:hypothetical protein